MITRREFLTGIAGALVLPRLAMSRQSSVTATKLTDTISLLNAGTNVVSLSTPDGALLVDSGAPEYAKALMSSTSRVRTVFNTHFHLDNTGANEALGQAGAKIIAHVST